MYEKIKIRKTISDHKIIKTEFFNCNGDILKDEDFQNDILKLVTVYNYENNIILEERFNEEGKLVWRNEEIFDEVGNKIKEYNGLGEKLQKSFYLYDENKRLSSITILDSDERTIRTMIYEYVNGNEYEKHFNSTGVLESFTITKYNEKSQRVRIIHFENPTFNSLNNYQSENFQEYFKLMDVFNYDIKGKKKDIQLSIHFLKYDIVYEYDKFGNEKLCEESKFHEDFGKTHLTILRANYNEYNENNLLVKNSSFEIHTGWDEQDETHYEYSFNENGDIINKTTDTGFKKIIEKFEYNEHGKLVYHIENHNNSEFTKERFYDDYGNKILEIEKYDYEDEEKEENTTKYEIEYYK
ncbi:hypothetical protein [Flavobacterium macrobrachii]|jgi:hypothetical protein|uniref:hypothetical protein n=1 Tax=Flavobacterium macrobrachii TaxID=591204 RepID=UPI0037BEE82C